ncbi:MAG TPA: tetratricopeptide repeat protein [Stellaceae bacterium]
MIRTLTVLVAAAALSGCAHEINIRNAARYHNAGLAAEQAGDYNLAERDYFRALINFRDGGAPEADLSMEIYNLGRMEGYNCKYDQAKGHLGEALAMEERLSGPESKFTTKRLFELARLAYDRGEYGDAATYYARGIPAAQKRGIEQSDPGTLADALDEYAAALRQSGQADSATRAAAEASSVRAAHPGASAKYNFVRYTQPCGR